MSKIDLESVKDSLLAIPAELVKSPSIPVSVYIQEAEDQKVWADDDKEVLTGHGLDWAFAESIPALAGALREAQSIWARAYKSREDAEKEWIEKSPEAFGMRDGLLSAFRYAFRKNDDLLSNVAVIAEGSNRDDMIQDLNDLAVLGRENTGLLEGINFDLARLDTAATKADEMAELLAGAKGEAGHENEELDLRNRAYTKLKEAVDEVRACGKYAFAGNAARLKGYRSEFLHKQNLKSRNDSDGMAA